MSLHRRSNGMALVVVVGGFFIIAYGYYTFSGLNNQLSIKDDIISRITQRKNEINNQLKVVYTHTTKLEQALKMSKEKYKETKLELLTKLNEFDANLTRTKHEAHNRFNALDTDYKMLKANYDEIHENHAALQQQYVRLSEDHKHVASEAKSDYDKLRDAKEAESISLQNRIQDLFNGKIYYQEKAKQSQEYYENTMKKYDEIKKLSLEYTERIDQYQQEIKNLKESLHSCRMSGSLRSRNDIVNSKEMIPITNYVAEEESLTTKAADISMNKVDVVISSAKTSTSSPLFNDTVFFVEKVIKEVPARLGLLLNSKTNEEHGSKEIVHEQGDFNKEPVLKENAHGNNPADFNKEYGLKENSLGNNPEDINKEHGAKENAHDNNPEDLHKEHMPKEKAHGNDQDDFNNEHNPKEIVHGNDQDDLNKEHVPKENVYGNDQDKFGHGNNPDDFNKEHSLKENGHGNGQEDLNYPKRYKLDNSEVKKENEVVENDLQNVLTITQPVISQNVYKLINDGGDSEKERETELENNAQQFLKQQQNLSLNKNKIKYNYRGHTADRYSKGQKKEKNKKKYKRTTSEKNGLNILHNNDIKISENIKVPRSEVYNDELYVGLDKNNASSSKYWEDTNTKSKVKSNEIYNPVQKPNVVKHSTLYKSFISNSNNESIYSLGNINYTTIAPHENNNQMIPQQQNQLQPLKKYNKEIFYPQSNERQLKPPKTVVNNIGVGDDKTVVNYIGANGDDKSVVNNIGANGDDKTVVNNIGADGDDKTVISYIRADGDDKTLVNNIGADGDDKTVISYIRADGDDKTLVNNIRANGDDKIVVDNIRANGNDKQSIEYVNIQNKRDKILPVEENQLQPPNLIKIKSIIEADNKPLPKSFDGNSQKKNDVKNIKDVTLEDDEHGDQNLDNVNKLDYQEDKQIKPDNLKLDSNIKSHQGEGIEGFEQKQVINEGPPAFNNAEKGEEENDEENEEGVDENDNKEK